MEAEICQAKQELTEYIDIDFDSMNIQEEEILHKDRKDQIQKVFKPPTHMTMSTDELSRIL